MAKKRHVFRYLLIALVFCTVCVIYVGRLFYIQIAGRDQTYDDGTTQLRVKVQAVRGELLDRNGKTLVSNRYTYDLMINYASISTIGIPRTNATYLRLLEALDVCGAADSHRESYFPFVGTYPDYDFSAEAKDSGTPTAYRLKTILTSKSMSEDASAREIVDEYLDTYRLLEKDTQGKPLYSNYQIDRLLRLHYDMDAMRFSLSNDYLFAEDTDLELMTYVREMGLVGVSFEVTAERVYLYPGIASHILGSVGPIYAEEWDYYNDQGYPMNAIVGKSGCEAAFEEYLRGVDGELLVTLDPAGNVIASEVITPPVSGKDVYLTIDIDLQIAAEEGLAENVDYVQRNDGNAVEGFLCDSGAAIAMDPNTFEIYAIASYPSYDLGLYNSIYNQLVSDPARPLVNRALRETYAPGSTFKVGVAAAGLDQKLISSSTTFPCNGIYTRFDDYKPKCSTHPHGVASLTVTKALAVSCNCFFYELGYQLGIGSLDSYMAELGFGRNTGIELGEATGVLAGEDGSYEGIWTPGNTVAAAIGQSETKATPLQLCAYISAIANKGARYSAHLLHKVCEFGSDQPIYSDADLLQAPLSQASMSDSVWATVMQGMKQMISESTTAKRFLTQSSVSSAHVGGKTGTAQIERYVTDEATGETSKHVITNALFVGVYAPDNLPQLTVSVVIEKASSGVYASLTAARIFGAWEDLTAERG
ncbi:MAG: hypothetical protein E7620_00530 [Ruminococcaceae bacterium]|nr:hypothetical protein [Oscillospiraceae bacterium]